MSLREEIQTAMTLHSFARSMGARAISQLSVCTLGRTGFSSTARSSQQRRSSLRTLVFEVAALFPRGHEREEGVAQAVGQADDVHGRLGVGDGCE